MNSAKVGVIAGSVLFWGFVGGLAVVDNLTPWDAPVAAYLIPLSAGVALTGAHLASSLVCRRIEAMAREASTAEAYKLALLTVGESLRPRRIDDSTELPRVAGDDYPHDTTVPIPRRPQLVHSATNGHRHRR